MLWIMGTNSFCGYIHLVIVLYNRNKLLTVLVNHGKQLGKLKILVEHEDGCTGGGGGRFVIGY